MADPTDDWRTKKSFEKGEPIDGALPDGTSRGLPLRLLAALGIVIALVPSTQMLLGAPLWLALICAIGAGIGYMWATHPAHRMAREERAALEALPPETREALARAEADLTQIDATAAGFDDESLTDALNVMTQEARKVLGIIRADPNDMMRAKKFLRVYIPSARRSVEKFAGLGVKDAELDARFRRLVEEMTSVCARQADNLTADDRTDLEVEMEVLADRLNQEI
ncbi:MAG: 5-bromo-4-chloroindolyl phosphate hydrolysis family protein [Pseudomonadota bacterium]